MRPVKKLSLAAAIVLTVLTFAAPAGALPTDVESGVLTTVLGNFDFAPGSQGTTPCPTKESTLHFTTTANPNRWTWTGGFSEQFQYPAGSGNWFQADSTLLAGSGGSWAGSAPTETLSGVLGIQKRIYQISAGACAKSNLRAIVTGAFTLAATSTYKAGSLNPDGLPFTVGAPQPDPTPPTPPLADHITIDAVSGPLVTSSASPPWNGLGGTVATITDLQAHVE